MAIVIINHQLPKRQQITDEAVGVVTMEERTIETETKIKNNPRPHKKMDSTDWLTDSLGGNHCTVILRVEIKNILDSLQQLRT